MRHFALALALLSLAGCVVVKPAPALVMGPNQVGGALVGAGAGALLGAQLGAGSGNLAAIGAGATLGAIIGGGIGESADRANAAPYYGYAPPPYAAPRYSPY
jgi:surface antigen